MFRIYFKQFNDFEDNRHFDILEECCVAFFRNLGPGVHKVEMYENLGSTEIPSWRQLVLARREREDEAFKVKRILNIF
jgi:hypothetical protein